jgi:hypothetical protein
MTTYTTTISPTSGIGWNAFATSVSLNKQIASGHASRDARNGGFQ